MCTNGKQGTAAPDVEAHLALGSNSGSRQESLCGGASKI